MLGTANVPLQLLTHNQQVHKILLRKPIEGNYLGDQCVRE
jgi:hypothetical protein